MAQIETVVTLLSLARLGAPVIEVGRTVLGTVEFVVARSRMRAVLKSAPRFVVAVFELLGRAVFVGKVPGCKHLAGNAVDQLRGCLSTLQRFARSDIARADKNERFGTLILFLSYGFPKRLLGRWSVLG